MGHLFFDTSALVKRYCEETDTDVVDELTFVCADDELVEVAEARGLDTFNPNTDDELDGIVD